MQYHIIGRRPFAFGRLCQHTGARGRAREGCSLSAGEDGLAREGNCRKIVATIMILMIVIVIATTTMRLQLIAILLT